MHRFSESIKALTEEWNYLSCNFENPTEEIQERIEDIKASVLDIVNQVLIAILDHDDWEDLIRKIGGIYERWYSEDLGELQVLYDPTIDTVTLKEAATEQDIMYFCLYLLPEDL